MRHCVDSIHSTFTVMLVSPLSFRVCWCESEGRGLIFMKQIVFYKLIDSFVVFSSTVNHSCVVYYQTYGVCATFTCLFSITPLVLITFSANLLPLIIYSTGQSGPIYSQGVLSWMYNTQKHTRPPSAVLLGLLIFNFMHLSVQLKQIKSCGLVCRCHGYYETVILRWGAVKGPRMVFYCFRSGHDIWA